MAENQRNEPLTISKMDQGQLMDYVQNRANGIERSVDNIKAAIKDTRNEISFNPFWSAEADTDAKLTKIIDEMPELKSFRDTIAEVQKTIATGNLEAGRALIRNLPIGVQQLSTAAHVICNGDNPKGGSNFIRGGTAEELQTALNRGREGTKEYAADQAAKTAEAEAQRKEDEARAQKAQQAAPASTPSTGGSANPLDFQGNLENAKDQLQNRESIIDEQIRKAMGK